MKNRLLQMIDRLICQRACLDMAAAEIGDRPGVVLEIGLGKGRTYSHLREIVKGREIFAFDRHVHAPDDAQPDDAHTILGDFRDTVTDSVDRFGGQAVLIHADIGSTKPDRDRQLAADLSPAIAALAAPGAIVLCDRALTLPEFAELPLPEAAGTWPYYLYRAPS